MQAKIVPYLAIIFIGKTFPFGWQIQENMGLVNNFRSGLQTIFEQGESFLMVENQNMCQKIFIICGTKSKLGH